MASAIRLLFHPRGRDRPYFILLPRPRTLETHSLFPERRPIGEPPQKTTAMLFSCLLCGSLTANQHPLALRSSW